MVRLEAREQAFLMLCEYGFDCTRSAEEIYETAKAARAVEEDSFIREEVSGVIEKREVLDAKIEEHAKGWKMERMSVVTASVLRLGAYELLFRADIPVNVALNEAIELAKKYDDDKARAFVNGVLNALTAEAVAARPNEA